MGGFGAAIDRADAQPDEILAYATRHAARAAAPAGTSSPRITYGLPGTVFPHVDQYLDQAVNEYNAGLHIPVTPLSRRAEALRSVPQRPRLVQAAASAQRVRRCVREHRPRARARPAEKAAHPLPAGARRGLRAGRHSLRGHDRRHEPPRRGVLRQPRVRSRNAHGRALHVRRHGASEAPDGRRGHRARRPRVPRHREGRHARHRQEPRQDHDGGQRHRGL